MPGLRSLLAAGLALLAQGTAAHEVRPGYLELRETAPAEFTVLWKVPLKGALQLPLQPVLPENCTETTPVSQYPGNGATIERWSVRCPEGLTGGTIAIDGLDGTLTDVLVRIERPDGGALVERLQPSNPTMTVSADPSGWQVAGTYLALGVEHILLGVDHLLFVLALLIIVRGWRRLIATITAFTVAHSITLAAATLGLVQVPPRPVEAVIALSILFLAVEIVHGRQGRAGLAERAPWVVAFTFGLLHGFGFAGALAQVGLPEQSIPLALLCFNLGVELGQLLFVGAVLGIGWAVRRVRQVPLARLELPATYAIGSLAAFWTLERVGAFWG